MVDRDVFDEWLRERAASADAVRQRGTFDLLSRGEDGVSVVHFETRDPHRRRNSTAETDADAATSVAAGFKAEKIRVR